MQALSAIICSPLLCSSSQVTAGLLLWQEVESLTIKSEVDGLEDTVLLRWLCILKPGAFGKHVYKGSKIPRVFPYSVIRRLETRPYKALQNTRNLSPESEKLEGEDQKMLLLEGVLQKSQKRLSWQAPEPQWTQGL